MIKFLLTWGIGFTGGTPYVVTQGLAVGSIKSFNTVLNRLRRLFIGIEDGRR